MMDKKIQSFKDLIVWQKAVDFAAFIYSLTSKFPKQEEYGLTSQLRRAAVSISSNIAEGFTRNSRREKQQFYAIARGSLIEVESQLEVARRVGYVNDDNYHDTVERLETIRKMLDKFSSTAVDRKKTLIRVLVFFFILNTVYGILYTVPAYAQVGLAINQSLFDITLPPGAEQEVYTVVMNQSATEALPIQVSLTMWGLNDETEQIEFTTAEDELNAVKWFELQGNPNIILNPSDGKEVKWKITVPPQTPAGSYLVMAQFIPILPEHYFTADGPRSYPTLGALFFIKVVPLGFDLANAYQAQITAFNPQGNGWHFIGQASAGLYASLASAFQALIKNNGLYFFKAQGVVEVTNWWGSTIAQMELPAKYLLPGKARKLEMQGATESWLKSRLHFGLYHARLALAVPNNELPIVSETSFWVVPWDLLLIVLAVAGAVIFSRRRLLKAVKILTKGKPVTIPVDHIASYGIIDRSIKPRKPKAKPRATASAKVRKPHPAPAKSGASVEVKRVKRRPSVKKKAPGR